MRVHTPIPLAAVAPLALATVLLAGCGAASGGGSPATAAGNSTGTSGSQAAPATSNSATQAGSGTSASSNAKCTDLTAAAASAAVGKTVTVTLDPSGANLPGMTICDISAATDANPIQLDVNTSDTTAQFAADEQAYGGKDLSGVGDKAFTSSIGVEVLSGSVDIQVIGPAGPVLSNDYTIPTAVAKAMIAALS
jgi:hypothetical protein